LKQQFAERQSSTQSSIEIARQGRERAEADLAEYQSQFDSILSDKDAVIRRFQERAHELTVRAEQAELTGEADRTELQGQIRRLQDWVRLLKEKDRPTAIARPEPLGEVVRVASNGRNVYINLGSRQGVARGLTFSIYDRNSSASRPKAKIEVARVISDELSEAQVVESERADPILPGDKLVNLVFKPGRQKRVALAGFFDLDRDGRDDRRLVRALVQRAGAAIDAEVTSDGKLEGELTVDTNFLILGAEPPGASAEALQVMSELIRTAQAYSVPQISLERFLEGTGLSWSQ
jgi:hypothetical protein